MLVPWIPFLFVVAQDPSRVVRSLFFIVPSKFIPDFTIKSYLAKEASGPTTAPLKCPVNYTEGENDNCYKLFAGHFNYIEASATCKKDGGSLTSIHSAFENDFVQQMAKDGNTLVWLGLNCSDSEASHCRWDDNSGVPYPYNAFYAAQPNAVIGQCVLMLTGGAAGGRWLSADCDNMQIGFICQILKQDTCGDFAEFKDECYRAFEEALSMEAAESECADHCGHLASIHSNDENSMIKNLFGAQASYARIGLQRTRDGSYAWTDNGALDYNNFGNNNTAFGACVAMSLMDELVDEGRWITVKCAQELPFVCKRERGLCHEPTIAQPLVTLAPPTCDSAEFFDNSGSIYSPGYPTPYKAAKACTYILSVPPEEGLVQIHFVDLHLGQESRLELYNSFVDAVPFLIINTSIPSTSFFTSSTNVMKMIYRPGDQKVNVDRWHAEFSPEDPTASTPSVTVTGSPQNPSHCNDISYVPTNITSPAYPNPYPALTECRYQLEAHPGFRISLTFGAIDTEQCCDIISVYDYDGSVYNPLLDRISGKITAGLTFESTLNQMIVEFSADSLNEGIGFSATAVIVR